MIKKMAWNTFKNTGDINTFLEFKQIQGIENQLHQNHPRAKCYAACFMAAYLSGVVSSDL
jgi:hypothetical protein